MALRQDLWVELADGPCAACGFEYPLEFEIRCAVCDDGLCALCWITAVDRSGACCPGCGPET